MRCCRPALILALQFSIAMVLPACEPGESRSAPEPIVSNPLVRVERRPVAGGGELFTYFSRLPEHHAAGAEIPMISVLRDTLGDAEPANDRTRYVYAFGYTRPSLLQRLAAGVPFFYRRAGGDSRNATPSALVDVADPARGTIPKLIGAGLQSTLLDPLGVPYRTATRAYRGRSSEHRSLYTYRSIEVLRTAPPEAGGLSKDEAAEVQGRLVLSNSLWGGLVSNQRAPEAWIKRRDGSSMNRGRNWDLLRQSAEENGLEFQPLRIGSDESNFAMLWIEQGLPDRKFDGKFLALADPYRDNRVRHWTGYSQTWFFDSDGNRVDGTADYARSARMIPLGLYALDHPKVPFLLVDFRAPGKVKRREMALRFTDDLTTGVLGLTGWGNWPYMAAKSGWLFVHGRRGGAVNRAARIRAYGQLRQGLLMDRTLTPELHAALVRHVDRLGWNPLEDDIQREVQDSQRQYYALIARLEAKGALALDRERLRELHLHSPAAQFGLRMACAGTLGIYCHHDSMTPERLEAVDRVRRQEISERERLTVIALPPASSTAPINSGGN